MIRITKNMLGPERIFFPLQAGSNHEFLASRIGVEGQAGLGNMVIKFEKKAFLDCKAVGYCFARKRF